MKYRFIIFILVFILSLFFILSPKNRIGYLGNVQLHIYHTAEINGISYSNYRYTNNNHVIVNRFFIEGNNTEFTYKTLREYLETNNKVTNYYYTFVLKDSNILLQNKYIYNYNINTNYFISNNQYFISFEYNNKLGHFISTNSFYGTNNINNIYFYLQPKIIPSILLIIFLILLILIYIFFPFVKNCFIIPTRNFLFFIIELINRLKFIRRIDYFFGNIFNLYVSKLSKDFTYYLLIFCILSLSISIRLFYASQKLELHWDEVFSILASNNTFDVANTFYKQLNNTLGEEYFKRIFFDNDTFIDALNDIKSLYYNSKDTYISNLYYSILRIFFTGYKTHLVQNILLRSSILNCLFYIISFIYLFKLLKLIFNNQRYIILFSLLVLSLNPSSIDFTIFMRPYQMQEMFFIIILYTVLNTVINNKYSIKNFIFTTIISGLCYLTLSSSLVYILSLSFLLFVYFIIQLLFKNIKYTININIKTLLYYALSFNLGLLVSQLLYRRFFITVFSQNNRSSGTIKNLDGLYSFINKYSFNDLFTLVLVLLILLIVFNLIIRIRINNLYKFDSLIFIILSGLLFSIIAHILSPFYLSRYSANGYMFILFLLPLILYAINNKSIKLIFIVFISMVYLFNINNKNRLQYLNITYNRVFYKDIPVYAYNTFFYEVANSTYSEINTNVKYFYIESLDTLSNKIKHNNYNFYLILDISNNSLLLNTNLFSNYNIRLIKDLNFNKNIYEVNIK